LVSQDSEQLALVLLTPLLLLLLLALLLAGAFSTLDFDLTLNSSAILGP
jgi:hypothetical protein